MSFKSAIYAILTVMLMHIVILIFGLYDRFLWTDIPMHFFGGFVMALLALAIHHHVGSRYHNKRSPWWYHFGFVLGFTMLIGVGWEFYEYVLDHTLNRWFGFPLTQLSLTDTMGDFLNDGLGGAMAFFIFRKKI